MFNIFRKILSVGVVTQTGPEIDPPGFLGPPSIDLELCDKCEEQCVSVCPTDALSIVNEGGQRIVKLSLADCTFCGWCQPACPNKAITMTKEFRLAVRDRASLERQFAPNGSTARRSLPVVTDVAGGFRSVV